MAKVKEQPAPAAPVEAKEPVKLVKTYKDVVLDGVVYEVRGDKVFKKLESGDVEVTTGDRKQTILSLAS